MSFLMPKPKPAPSFLGAPSTAATNQAGVTDGGGFKAPTPPPPPTTMTPAPGKPKLKSAKPTFLGTEAIANPAYSISKPGFGTNTLLGHG